MSHYIENHLRIWGKDAEAFMKAAAGEEYNADAGFNLFMHSTTEGL